MLRRQSPRRVEASRELPNHCSKLRLGSCSIQSVRVAFQFIVREMHRGGSGAAENFQNVMRSPNNSLPIVPSDPNGANSCGERHPLSFTADLLGAG